MSHTLYENPEIWNQELQLGQRNLLAAILDFWPSGVNSVLDAGCGDGKLTLAIAKSKSLDNIIGCDSSAEALSRVHGITTIQGDITQLPFSDDAFDMVICTDVLEHLNRDDEHRAWKELFRTAKHHVFCAVPWQENLWDGMTKCPRCHHVYHVNWHQRSYQPAAFTHRIPPSWELPSFILTGEPWPPRHPIETHFRRHVLEEWNHWENAVCPQCGTADQPDNQPAAPLPQLLATALSEEIAQSTFPNNRYHSELLLVASRQPDAFHNLSIPEAIATTRMAHSLEIVKKREHLSTNLPTFPRVASLVQGADGNLIAQFAGPDSGTVQVFSSGDDTPSALTFEDALGSINVQSVDRLSSHESTIQLVRKPVAGNFGVLIRIPENGSFEKIQFVSDNNHELLTVEPDTSQPIGYFKNNSLHQKLWMQATGKIHLDCEQLDFPFGLESSQPVDDRQLALNLLRFITRQAHTDEKRLLEQQQISDKLQKDLTRISNELIDLQIVLQFVDRRTR